MRLVFVLALVVGCTSSSVFVPPLPLQMPGIPDPYWRICVDMATQGFIAVADDPQLTHMLTEGEKRCIKALAAADCGRALQKIASKTNDTRVVGAWCPADFFEAASKEVERQCGDNDNEFTREISSQVVDEITKNFNKIMKSRPGAN